MPAELPAGWLRVQALTWPLRSEVAFHAARVAFDAGAHAELSGEFEAFIRTRAGGMSLDSLRTLVRAAWSALDGAGTLHGHVERIADETLAWAGDRVVLRGAGDQPESLARWRWLSLSAPPDLLVAALAARHRQHPLTETVTLPDRNLARAFAEQPFAVTHLHVGAAVPFGPLWAGLMRRVAGDDLGDLRVEDGGPPPFIDPEVFRARLLQAAIVRVLLASFLWHREMGADGAGLGEFLAADRAAPGLTAVCARLGWAGGAGEAAYLLVDALRALVVPENRVPHWPAWHGVYRQLVAPTPPRPRRFFDVVAADPLAGWLAPAGTATPETRFAVRALAYLAQAPRDGLFAQAFWQYQRVRCRTYLHLVEERGTAGLDWFSRHYQRISGMREGYDDFLFEAAFLTEGRGVALRSLEGRTSPAGEWQQVREQVRDVASNARRMTPPTGSPAPEVGLVLHFIKEHDFAIGRRRWSHADPDQPVYRCRYGRWLAQRLAQASAIRRALTEHPELLCILRGVDVANVELAVPTWAVAPLIRVTRRASHAAAAECGRRWPDWQVEPLRATWHAGEDFTRLCQGLRAIHEPIQAGAIWSADRLGHAVALGVRPERWALAAGVVTQPAEDRLDDLLWEWDRYAAGDVPPQPGRLLRIEQRIEALAARIYGPGRYRVPDVALARRLRLRPGVLRGVGFPGRNYDHPALADDVHADGGAGEEGGGVDERLGGDERRAWQRLNEYLHDSGVYRRGREGLEIEVDAAELEFLAAAQRWLAGRLESLSITVETNPSSNLLIGDFVDMEDHPAFRMEPLRPGDPDALGVAITINSDNPLTFGTSLGDEFTYMYTGLRRAGVTGGDALGWLNRVREAAWRARFTLPASADASVLERIERGRPSRTFSERVNG